MVKCLLVCPGRGSPCDGRDSTPNESGRVDIKSRDDLKKTAGLFEPCATHYNLEAYVVMANHVHLLVVPYISPTRFLQSLKSYTARQANKLLGRTGEPFWQRESYDHWVRDEAERRRIISYIENNPVKAGLVNSPRKYPWSSAAVRENGAAARKTSVEKSLDAAR